MKKGISLIVLVITIIVLAILAGAVIISLSNTNIIDQATKAKVEADFANAKNTVTLAYAEGVANGNKLGKNDGLAYTSDVEESAKAAEADYYVTALQNAGFTGGLKVSVKVAGGVPTVTKDEGSTTITAE